MAFKDLREYLSLLEKENELLRIKETLSPNMEIAAALRYLDRQEHQAVIFESVEGYPVKVVGDLFGSRRRLQLAMETEGDLTEACQERAQTRVPPVMAASAPVHDVVISGSGVNIAAALPLLTHHAKDAGPYITTGVVVCKHPVTGIRGMGIHRIQLKGPNKIGAMLASPPVAECFRVAEAAGQRLPFAIVIGVEPVTFLASIAWMPEGEDKYALAGALRRQPVELVKCRTVDLEVPAFAEFVLEGEFLPHLREEEGPFGESSGYYITANNQVGEVQCITHRHGAIYHALMPFNRENAMIKGVLWEGAQLQAIREKYPQIQKIRLRGAIGQHAVVQIAAENRDAIKDLLKELLITFPFLKQIIAVDPDVDIDDPKEIEWALATRCQPAADLVVLEGLPCSAIDPSARGGLTSKWGINATRLNSSFDQEKITVDQEAYAKVKALLSI